MTVIHWCECVVVLLLFVYLFAALLKPEWFS